MWLCTIKMTGLVAVITNKRIRVIIFAPTNDARPIVTLGIDDRHGLLQFIPMLHRHIMPTSEGKNNLIIICGLRLSI